MKAIDKLVEASLVKLGFFGVEVLEIACGDKPQQQLVVDVDIPVRALMPFLTKFLRECEPKFTGRTEDHPIGKYCLGGAMLKAGPVNLGSFRFSVRVSASHLRLLTSPPEMLHEGFNREKLEYVYYRSGIIGKDLILGLVEQGGPFITYLHDLIQTGLMEKMPLINAVLEKVLESSCSQILKTFYSEQHQLDTQIVAEAVPVSVADTIIASDWLVNTVSGADKYFNHLQRYLSGRVMRRRIFAVLDCQGEQPFAAKANLGSFTSPLLVTEYLMTGHKSASLYRKAINNSLKQLPSCFIKHDSEALYM